VINGFFRDLLSLERWNPCHITSSLSSTLIAHGHMIGFNPMGHFVFEKWVQILGFRYAKNITF
jgi:hypothetical protein